MFLIHSPAVRVASHAGVLAVALGLVGCDRGAAPPAGAVAPAAAPLADPRLVGLYERACANCHDADGSGAPRRGDRAAWAPREAAGLPALLASVRQGKGTMPPMGWCPECSDDDFNALIAHLRQPAGAAR